MTKKAFEYLYHLTDAALLSELAAEGLDPQYSRAFGWSERLVYLAGDEIHADGYADHHSEKTWESAMMLRVRFVDLDTEAFRPDDVDMPDLMKQNGDERDLDEVTWTESLYTSGQCGYAGIIPPLAIEVRLRGETNEWMPLEEFVRMSTPHP